MAVKHNLIVVEGEEYYLRKKKIEEIVGELLPSGFSDFNYIKLDGKNTDFREILSCWEELPFGAPRRVVHVEDYNKVKLPAKNDRVAKIFEENLKKGSIKKSFLILECDSFDKRKSVNGLIASNCDFFTFKRVREWEFPAKIVSYVKEKGMEIDRDAVDLLASSFSDLMNLFSEIDKLVAFKSGKGRITIEDVKAVVFPSKTYTFFDLQDAIIQKKLDKALKVGKNLIDNGVSFSSIAGFLESSFKKSFHIAFGESLPSKMSYYEKKLYSLAQIYGRSGIEKSLVIIYKVITLSRKGDLSDSVYLSYLLTFLNRFAKN